MARILAVDDDALARAVLVDALRGMHHEVVAVAGGREALERVLRGDITLVITDVRMPEMDGIELARRVAALEKGPPVLLASGVRGPDVAVEARRQGVNVAGFVAKPLVADALRAAITRATLPSAEAAGDWNGEETLTRVGGPLEVWPVHRLLFLAHRVRATGALHVVVGEADVTVFLRGGAVQYVAGAPDLLGSLPSPGPDRRDLGQDVEQAVAAGIPVDDVLRAAAEGLGGFVAGLVGVRGGDVRWVADASAPPGSPGLPMPIPRLLALGFRARRAHQDVLSFWSTADRTRIRLSVPVDSPETRWGLDMTALRVLRLVPKGQRVGDLVAAAVGNDADRRPEVLRALDLLYLLGLVQLQHEGPAPAAPVPTHEVVRDRRGEALRALLTTLEGLPPLDTLQLGEREKVTAAEVGAAWRELSREVHPDRLVDAPADVRTLAAAVFDKLRAANEALSTPAALEEANRVLEARRKGVPYVTERDRAAARVALRRGETLFRSREWKSADLCFVEANRLDPLSWPIPLYHAWCGWLSRRLSAADALGLLQGLEAPTPAGMADVHVAIGTILKMEGKADIALARFRLAAEKDPENREAQRELRLHDRRAQPVAPAGGSLLENLRATLNRPIGGTAPPPGPAKAGPAARPPAKKP